ncbi:MAG: FliH/SctL family protein [Bdellovibrionia bacterium]
MSKFHGNDFNISEDDALNNAPRVVKTSQPVERHVQSFQMTNLNQQGSPKSGFTGAAAASGQSPRTALGNKQDQRFMLSQLAREALSIGKEEEKIIEDRVAERLNELSEKTRQEAFAQGHAEGVKMGQAEAFQEFQAESQKQLEQLNALIQSMESAKGELFEANREFLMNAIYRVAKTILLKEISADREYLLRLSRELVERCGLRDNLTLKLHPSDADSIEMLRQGLLQSFSSLRNLSIELSEHVQAGGCILETEWGAIDASLETQLSQVLSTLDAAKGTAP